MLQRLHSVGLSPLLAPISLKDPKPNPNSSQAASCTLSSASFKSQHSYSPVSATVTESFAVSLQLAKSLGWGGSLSLSMEGKLVERSSMSSKQLFVALETAHCQLCQRCCHPGNADRGIWRRKARVAERARSCTRSNWWLLLRGSGSRSLNLASCCRRLKIPQDWILIEVVDLLLQLASMVPQRIQDSLRKPRIGFQKVGYRDSQKAAGWPNSNLPTFCMLETLLMKFRNATFVPEMVKTFIVGTGSWSGACGRFAGPASSLPSHQSWDNHAGAGHPQDPECHTEGNWVWVTLNCSCHVRWRIAGHGIIFSHVGYKTPIKSTVGLDEVMLEKPRCSPPLIEPEDSMIPIYQILWSTTRHIVWFPLLQETVNGSSPLHK